MHDENRSAAALLACRTGTSAASRRDRQTADQPRRRTRRGNVIVLFSFVLAALLMGAHRSPATVLTVTNGDDSGPGSLRDTIASAVSGDTVVFAVTGAITLTTTQIVIDKSLTITGPAGGIIVHQQASDQRIFLIGNGTASGPTVTLSALTIENGSNPKPVPVFEDGGGIYNDRGKLTLQSCVMRECRVVNFGGQFSRPSGGGVASVGSTAELTVLNCYFTENLAADAGGAIFNRDGKLTVVGSLFQTNTSEHGPGGHISTRGSQASSIRENTFVAAQGTAIENVGSLQVLNCTFVANAPSGVDAGGIVNAGPLLVRHCTFQNNAGNNSGTIRNYGAGQLTVGNTIFQSNRAWSLRNDPPGVTTSDGYNLADSDPQGLLIGFGDQTNADARLDPAGLQNNGGPTPTIALLSSSPALDRGNNFGITTDQRGMPRPTDIPGFPNLTNGTDIGAYEAPLDPIQDGSAGFLVNTADDHDDGVCGRSDCSLREAINRTNQLPGADTIQISFGGTLTLDPSLGPLTVTGSTTITGPGARALSISGGNGTRVFNFSGGPSLLRGLTIRNGRAAAFAATPVGGAGLFNNGTLTVEECAFVGNQAAAGSGFNLCEAGGVAQGGGVFNGIGGALTLDRCTFTGNSATGGRGRECFSDFSPGGAGGMAQGAALFNESGATLTLTNCTMTNNSVLGGVGGGNTGGIGRGGNGGNGEGGGIYNGGTLDVRASTIARNTGTGGPGGQGSTPARNGIPGASRGGIAQGSASVTMRNSIVAQNTGATAPDVAGSFASEGYNLVGIGNGATGLNATGDQVGTSAAPINPNLGSLQNQGGPIDTVPLAANSPAMDKGKSFGLAIDARGLPRPVDLSPANASGGDGADIGAFEAGGRLAPFAAVSRKYHATEFFDLPLPVSGVMGIECRRNTGSDPSGPNAGHDHQVITAFNATVAQIGGVSVLDRNGVAVPASFLVSDNLVVVNLHGVGNMPERFVIQLNGVSDGIDAIDITVPLAVLLGDTNGNGTVNASDIGQTKAQSGQPANAANFATDVNVNGTINASDIGQVKAQSGSSLPP